MNRRHALCCGAGLTAGLFTGLCGALPRSLVGHDLLHQAFDGLQAARIVDTHTHLLGNGDGGSGCALHPSLQQWWHPVESLRRRVILGASGVDDGAASVDQAYLQRLAALAAGFPAGVRFWLFAFDHAHDEQGRTRADWSTFHVPDAYAAQVAAADERFAWVASIHPYLEDARQRLQAACDAGAVAVKWLPSAMNIDPADARTRAFCRQLAQLQRPLVVHLGEEKAVPGAGRDDFGNPLAWRAALAEGCTLIAAHAASLGWAEDTDRRSRPRVSAFALWARLMDEPDGRARLLADVSACWQVNRSAELQRALIEREDWHGRLLNGSDYPLPGVRPLVSLPRLVAQGLLARADEAPLAAVRTHNPLLFDFLLKRRLRSGSARLPNAVFEARALPAMPALPATVRCTRTESLAT